MRAKNFILHTKLEIFSFLIIINVHKSVIAGYHCITNINFYALVAIILYMVKFKRHGSGSESFRHAT